MIIWLRMENGMRVEETRKRVIAKTRDRVGEPGSMPASSGGSGTASSFKSRLSYFAETTAFFELMAGSAIGIATVVAIVAASPW